MKRSVGNFRPSVCFEVEKVIGVSVGEGNVKNYQVQWAPAWVSGTNLLGCEHLIEQFLNEQKHEQRQVGQQEQQQQQQQLKQLQQPQQQQPQQQPQQQQQQQQQQLQQQQQQQQQHQQQFQQQQQQQQQQDATPVIINVVDYGTSANLDAGNSNTNGHITNHFVERPTMLVNSGTTRVLSPLANNTNMNITVCKALNPVIQNIDVIKAEHRIRDISNDDDVENFIEKQQKPTNSVIDAERTEEQEEPSIKLINESIHPLKCNQIIDKSNLGNGKAKLVSTGVSHPDTLFQTPDNVYISMGYCDVDNSQPITIPSNGDTYQLHQIAVEAVKPSLLQNEYHTCPECGKTFSHRSAMVRHRQLHNKGHRPWVCPECLKPFTSKGAMDRHILLHTGNKSYTCAECHKSFSRKDALTRHFRQHTGEKPYKCSECGKAFTDNSSYRVHMIKFHNTTPNIGTT